MFRLIVIVTFTISCICFESCSALIIPEQIPEEPMTNNTSPITKGGDFYDKDVVLRACHEIQSDHIMLLLNHLVVKDGKYELSLSSTDLDSLVVREQERAIVNEYKKILNSQSYEKAD